MTKLKNFFIFINLKNSTDIFFGNLNMVSYLYLNITPHYFHAFITTKLDNNTFKEYFLTTFNFNFKILYPMTV